VNASLTTAIISVCLLVAVSIGICLRRFLPDDHVSPDGRDNMKLAMGPVATISALLLGLVVSFAKVASILRQHLRVFLAPDFSPCFLCHYPSQQFDPLNNRTKRSIALTVLSFIISVLFLAGCASVPAGRHVDFSNYDKTLTEQVTDRIKAKVAARLGEGKNLHDRYFIIPFAYENKGNDPKFSHSFLSVIRVFADDSQPKVDPGLIKRAYKGREFEAFTISWLPHDFPENPNLCVFEGFGAALIPSLNRCPLSEGKSFDLPTTLNLAVQEKGAVGMWGPYEITKPGFDLAVKRLRLLEKGTIKYVADDRRYRKDLVAINCFHAIAGLHDFFPNGGLFGTGFKMWGLNGTRRVLIEYTTRDKDKGLLLEPVDIKKDLIGFVYAPDRTDRGVYDPFENAASAYHK
jgi:hypothetical protein